MALLLTQQVHQLAAVHVRFFFKAPEQPFYAPTIEMKDQREVHERLYHDFKNKTLWVGSKELRIEGKLKQQQFHNLSSSCSRIPAARS